MTSLTPSPYTQVQKSLEVKSKKGRPIVGLRAVLGQHPTHPQLFKGLSDSESTSGYPKVYLSPFKHGSSSKYRSKSLFS